MTHEAADHVRADGETLTGSEPLTQLPLPGQRDLPARLLHREQELPLESRHPGLQVLDILYKSDVLLSESIELGLGTSQLRFPVLPTPPGGFVVKVAHPPIFEGGDLVISEARGRVALVGGARETEVRIRVGGGFSSHSRQLGSNLARSDIYWTASLPGKTIVYSRWMKISV